MGTLPSKGNTRPDPAPNLFEDPEDDYERIAREAIQAQSDTWAPDPVPVPAEREPLRTAL